MKNIFKNFVLYTRAWYLHAKKTTFSSLEIKFCFDNNLELVLKIMSNIVF